MPDPLLLVNSNGTVVDANRAAVQSLQAPGTSLVGMGVLDLLPEFDPSRIPGSMRPPASESESLDHPVRMTARRTDGSTFIVEVSGNDFTDDGAGESRGFVSYATTDQDLLLLLVRDLSARLAVEAELRRQHKQTEMILRAAAEGVLGVDLEGRVVLVNPAAAHILDYRASELGGRELHPLIQHSQPDGSPLALEGSALLDTLVSGRKHRVKNTVLWRKNGTPVTVDLTTAPVRDGDQLVGAVMTFTDRTTELTLAARNEHLTAVLENELGDALTALHRRIDALAADPAGQLWPEANWTLRRLADECRRFGTLIDGVLEHQRFEADADRGKQELNREAVGLDEVVRLAVERAGELVGSGRVRYSVHAAAVEVSVDRDRLAAALAHLVADVSGVTPSLDAGTGSPSLGVPALPPIGGDAPMVVLAAAQRGEVARVEVRGPSRKASPVHLPVARAAVERHGGVLQRHELPSRAGTTYVVELPLDPAASLAGVGVGRPSVPKETDTAMLPDLPALAESATADARGQAAPGGDGRAEAGDRAGGGSTDVPGPAERAADRRNGPIALGPGTDGPITDDPGAGGRMADGRTADGRVAGAPIAVGPIAVGPIAVGPIALGPGESTGGPAEQTEGGSGRDRPARRRSRPGDAVEADPAQGDPAQIEAGRDGSDRVGSGTDGAQASTVPGDAVEPAVRTGGPESGRAGRRRRGTPASDESHGALSIPGVPDPGTPLYPGLEHALPAAPQEPVPAPTATQPTGRRRRLALPSETSAERAEEATAVLPAVSAAPQPAGELEPARPAIPPIPNTPPDDAAQPQPQAQPVGSGLGELAPPRPMGGGFASAFPNAFPQQAERETDGGTTGPDGFDDRTGPPNGTGSQEPPTDSADVNGDGPGRGDRAALTQGGDTGRAGDGSGRADGASGRTGFGEVNGAGTGGDGFGTALALPGAVEGRAPARPVAELAAAKTEVPDYPTTVTPTVDGGPRRLLVWPEPDPSTKQALQDRGYRPVIVRSREEVDAQVSGLPAALFVDPLTGPITRTALQSLRTAALNSRVPVLVTAGLGQATRDAAYGADPAVLLRALAPRDSENHAARVLLVESDPDIAAALIASLERRGMHVEHASDENEAVSRASSVQPNLVVMDLLQIRRRRVGLLDWLRANDRLHRTPLVVYTSVDLDPQELPRLRTGETVLFLAERSTTEDVQSRIVDLLARIGAMGEVSAVGPVQVR